VSENTALADAAVCTRIRDRAYNLFCQRGRREGLAVQDWLQAEAEVLNELKLGPLAASCVSLDALETGGAYAESGRAVQTGPGPGGHAEGSTDKRLARRR